MSGELLWILPLLPAAVGGLLLAAGRRGHAWAPALAVSAALLTLWPAAMTWQQPLSSRFDWLPLAGGAIPLQLASAGAAPAFAALVAVVGLLVLVYSLSYMRQDPERARFFGWMSLFLGGMQLIALSGDLLTLLIGWELVGLCSYSLIGFWYREADRLRAAQRAFATTRAADLGLWLAAMAAFAGQGGFAFAGLAQAPAPGLIAAGLIVAAAGKSAQLPFSGWLSGAMLGPSPVSALLHSAAMVAAGVMLLFKAAPLLAALPWAAQTVLWLGVATVVAGALVAMQQADFKQVLAASTVSQMGYLFADLGAGGGTGVALQLLNHGVYKALLFLAAGVLLHQGMHRLDDMGGLRRRLPWLAAAVLVGVWALAPLPPVGGFFAKEALLAEIHSGSPLAYDLLLCAAPLTAAYAGFLYLRAFTGAPAQRAAAAEEPPPAQLWPVLVLALLALGLAVVALPPGAEAVAAALNLSPAPAPQLSALALEGLLAASGLVWAYYRLRAGRWLPFGAGFARGAGGWFGTVALLDGAGRAGLAVARRAAALERLAPERGVAAAVRLAARASAGLDRGLLDGGLVDGSALLARAGASLSALSDRRALDGAIGALARALRGGGRWLGRLQTGLLYNYYAQLALASLLLWGYAAWAFYKG